MDKDAGCIREISRRVRLSKSTVAKALHNCGNVDVGTKEAILRAAREVQYDPAGARRAKIQAGETVVGVVLPINPYAFWNEAIRGVKDAMAALKGAHLTLSLYAGMHSETDALYCLDYMEDMRADVLVVTSDFPNPRVNHWRTLLTARAIENQMFVVACNRVGPSPMGTYCGHSIIIDPWGDIIAEGGGEEEIITGSIDYTKTREVRDLIHMFRDRQPTLYGDTLLRPVD